MDRPSHAEMQQARVALFDYDDAPDLETLDRSTLDAWARCPWQAAAIESGRCKVVGIPAAAGNIIHECLSTVTISWVEGLAYDLADSAWQARDQLRTELEFELRRSRPDLQPEVLAGMMPSLWAWAKFLSEIRPGNVLAFDGGDEVGRSSQLAFDWPDLGARVTSELDLLYASRESVEVIEAIDYKTGHGTHDVYDVADSFQFQMHAFLILNHYQEVKALRLRVWNTRANRITYAANFPRSSLADYEWRVRSAVETRRRYRDDPPTWPTLESCRICPVAAICPVSDYPIKAEPADVLRDLIAVEARADALRERLTAHVDATGQDVVCNGVAFGRHKPPSNRTSPATLYETKESKNGDST